METILYKKTQHGYILWAVLIIFTIMMGFVMFLTETNQEKQIAMGFNIFLFVFLFLLTLIFSRLTITLTTKKIEAVFGLRIFKQQMCLESIKPENIEVFKPSSWYGIGLRLTPKGKLFNVKFGKAIRIETSQKTFFVGSDEAEHIKDLMIKELRKSDLS